MLRTDPVDKVDLTITANYVVLPNDGEKYEPELNEDIKSSLQTHPLLPIASNLNSIENTLVKHQLFHVSFIRWLSISFIIYANTYSIPNYTSRYLNGRYAL